MPEIIEYSKPEPTEINTFRSVSRDAAKLSSGLEQFGGVLTKAQHITKIDAVIVLIDNITALKTDLLADKAILQA